MQNVKKKSISGEVTAFLPIRKGSERVKDKNFRKFSNYENGLIELKLEQLIACDKIDRVIVSTTDERAFKFQNYSKKVDIIERPEELGLATTKTDDLVTYGLKLCETDWFLWTHVTSPLFDEDSYKKFIEESQLQIEYGNFDSSVTVATHKGYFFNKDQIALFEREIAKWPATQSINNIYEINNAGFIGKRNTLRKYKDRLGDKPYFYECTKIESIDIDWEEDFEIAETQYNSRLIRG